MTEVLIGFIAMQTRHRFAGAISNGGLEKHYRVAVRLKANWYRFWCRFTKRWFYSKPPEDEVVTPAKFAVRKIELLELQNGEALVCVKLINIHANTLPHLSTKYLPAVSCRVLLKQLFAQYLEEMNRHRRQFRHWQANQALFLLETQ